jgi:hypothetical protein
MHYYVNKYLHRIGKRNTADCECGGGEQSVKHVMLECEFTENERKEAERKGGEQFLEGSKVGCYYRGMRVKLNSRVFA